MGFEVNCVAWADVEPQFKQIVSSSLLEAHDVFYALNEKHKKRNLHLLSARMEGMLAAVEFAHIHLSDDTPGWWDIDAARKDFIYAQLIMSCTRFDTQAKYFRDNELTAGAARLTAASEACISAALYLGYRKSEIAYSLAG